MPSTNVCPPFFRSFGSFVSVPEIVLYFERHFHVLAIEVPRASSVSTYKRNRAFNTRPIIYATVSSVIVLIRNRRR